MRSLYGVLGVSPGAGEEQIKSAYRALARRLHPDVNPGDAASAERLAEINRAYETLRNPEARAAYDRDIARRQTDARWRNRAFAATALVTFVATAGVMLFAVRWHLGASARLGLPAGIATKESRDGPQNRMQDPAQHGLDTAGPGGSAHAAGAANWTTYRDSRFAFALRYPAGIFAFDAGQSNANVQTFVSRDGRAVLRIIVAENTSGITLGSFRRSLIQERYAGASFDETPRRQHWFALSGTRGGEVFLERVTFSCDGKSMHGWQMRYPSTERATYDEVARLVLRNYPHGNGPGAGCDEARDKPQAARRKRG